MHRTLVPPCSPQALPPAAASPAPPRAAETQRPRRRGCTLPSPQREGTTPSSLRSRIPRYRRGRELCMPSPTRDNRYTISLVVGRPVVAAWGSQVELADASAAQLRRPRAGPWATRAGDRHCNGLRRPREASSRGRCRCPCGSCCRQAGASLRELLREREASLERQR
jgi:hypothetical protein